MGGIYSVVHGGVHTGRDMTVRYAELLLQPPPPLIETKPGPAGELGTVAVVAGRPRADFQPPGARAPEKVHGPDFVKICAGAARSPTGVRI